MTQGQLKRTLGPASLWGLGVGYVISGEYFGWNLGLPLGGSFGMLWATLLVTLMYVCFVLSYAELACALPRAGGAFVYADRALGPFGGCIAGFAQAIEFALAPPAIAMAIGAYLTQRFGDVDPRWFALAAYVLFTGLNAWGVRQAALFELWMTGLAVAELLLFAAVTLPAFRWQAFATDPLPHGTGGVFAALPFAMWFYLAIEGVANVAEEAKNPQRDVAFGFGAALITLVVLALLVFFAATGVAGWRAIVYPPGSDQPSDAPLPLALELVVGQDSLLYALLLGVGLFGLIASFHGILLSAARATMELGRARYAPAILSRIHAGSGTPRAALLGNLLVGLLAILTGSTSQIIVLACFGALLVYAISMVSLIRLRQTEPHLPRPYRALGYPWLAWLALLLSLICGASLTWANPEIATAFCGLMGLSALAFQLRVRSASGGVLK
jgi:ethanolamine permease